MAKLKKKIEEVVETPVESAPLANKLGTDEPKTVLAPLPEGEGNEIALGTPISLKVTELPFVVKLPANASPAQKDYARFLNAYAYQNPEKWENKKDVLARRLKLLEGLDVPVGGGTVIKRGELTSSASYVFIPDGKGGELYAGAR